MQFAKRRSSGSFGAGTGAIAGRASGETSAVLIVGILSGAVVCERRIHVPRDRMLIALLIHARKPHAASLLRCHQSFRSITILDAGPWCGRTAWEPVSKPSHTSFSHALSLGSPCPRCSSWLGASCSRRLIPLVRKASRKWFQRNPLETVPVLRSWFDQGRLHVRKAVCAVHVLQRCPDLCTVHNVTHVFPLEVVWPPAPTWSGLCSNG